MKSSIKVTKVKKGRRTYGATYKLPDGTVIYLAWRKLDQMFRSGEKSLSTAIREGKAAWAIDQDTLISMRAAGVKHVGILCKTNDDIWLTKIDHFFNAKILNYERRGGSMQRYLPLKYFKRRAGVTRFR